MAQSYIPIQDPQALIWLQTFANHISDSPSTYMLAVSDAMAINQAVQAYAAALAIASDSAKRTPVSITQKDTARNTAIQLCRQYAIMIKNNGGITDAAKIAVGVRPVHYNRDPVACPQSSPGLLVVAATPGAHTVRYSDSLTPTSGAKPFGATELQLHVAIKDEPTTFATDATFYGKFTKNPIAVVFAETDDGKVATYFARWASRRGEVGQWSLPVSMRISA